MGSIFRKHLDALKKNVTQSADTAFMEYRRTWRFDDEKIARMQITERRSEYLTTHLATKIKEVSQGFSNAWDSSDRSIIDLRLDQSCDTATQNRPDVYLKRMDGLSLVYNLQIPSLKSDPIKFRDVTTGVPNHGLAFNFSTGVLKRDTPGVLLSGLEKSNAAWRELPKPLLRLQNVIPRAQSYNLTTFDRMDSKS